MASVQDGGLLKADYGAFQNAANQLTGLHDAMQQINNDLINRTQAVAGGSAMWSGRAAQTFAARLTEAAQLTQGILNQLQAAGTSIPTIIGVIQDADARGGGLFAASV